MDFLTDFAKFESNTNGDNRDFDFSTIKGFVLGTILSNLRNKRQLPKRLFSALQELKRNNDILITKADKGNKVVIMDENTYMDKMNLLLNDESTYKKLTSDPLKRWQTSYNGKLKSLLQKDFPVLYKKFKAYLPKQSNMYGLPKIHKDGIPMRPITSTRNSVTYNLSKWIAKLLSPCLGTISPAHLKDTNSFVNKIRNVNLKNKKVVGFAVVIIYQSTCTRMSSIPEKQN